MVKETRPLQSARFNNYIKAGINHVEAFALLSNKDASDYFDLVLGAGVRRGEESKVAAELFVKEMWYSVRRVKAAQSVCECVAGLQVKTGSAGMPLLAWFPGTAAGKHSCERGMSATQAKHLSVSLEVECLVYSGCSPGEPLGDHGLCRLWLHSATLPSLHDTECGLLAVCRGCVWT